MNKNLPLSAIGPNWAGVSVRVTETGFSAHGVLESVYGFNLGTHVGDSLPAVELRRSGLQAHMGAPIVWLNQVHGCEVFSVGDALPSSPLKPTTPMADASVCMSSDFALAIMTADCLPVVFAAFDHGGQAVGVAAAHAGWRGLHAGVLQACAESLAQACGVRLHLVKAWLGPAIGPCSFEVGQEVFDFFVQQNKNNQFCFQQKKASPKFLADIYGLARIALRSAGVVEVDGGGLDTFTDLRWFSHRRGQQQGRASGRFATLVRLLPLPSA